jgi:uncharacterized protein YkwD
VTNGERSCARGPRLLAAAVAASLTLVASPHAPAFGTGGEEARFVSLTNGARANAALAAYAVSYDLVSLARRHSQEMASRHTIYHNSRLTSDVCCWRAVGENVGMGPDVDSIHRAFMSSADHRSNILDRDFTQIGVGTAHDENGRLYVTEVFRQPYSAPPPPPPPVVRRPRRPAPVPRRVAPPAPPSERVVLLHRLTVARAIVAKARPRTPVAHALTYVKVMTALAG